MLLCHALALHKRGIPLYADVLPPEGMIREGLEVTEIDPSQLAVAGLEVGAILHGCLAGSPFEGIETSAGRITLHLQGEDPVSALLSAGMTEDELNQMVLEAFRNAQEMAG